jgi:acyl carrier protein
VLEEAVREQLAPVLRVSPDRVARDRTLEAMGVDSLMALEFRNRLESESGVKLSATLAFNYPTVAAVAEHLGSRMHIPLDRLDSTDDQDGAEETEPDEHLDDSLSRDDIEAMLADELAAADRLLETDGRTSA